MITSEDLTILWRNHSAALLLLARGRCGHYATSIADDCVQEAFIRLAATEPVPDDPVAWLTTVVRNIAIDIVRSQRRRKTRETHVAADTRHWMDPSETSLFDAQMATNVERALQELDDTTRDVVIAHIWNRMTFRQIAQSLQMSHAKAHRTYAAGIERLKAVMTSGEECDVINTNWQTTDHNQPAALEPEQHRG